MVAATILMFTFHLFPLPLQPPTVSDFPRDCVLQVNSFLLVLLLFPAMISGPNTVDTVCDAFNRCSRKVGEATRQAEIIADNFWNHIRIGSNFADAAMARIVQGTKVLAHGGSDKLFQQIFGIFPGEKLLKPYACYISTSSGPVIGTLYVSTKRLAFCSDYPLSDNPFSMQNHSTYYKVLFPLLCKYLVV